jgi:AraC-like DNA-binding protein
MRGDPLSDTLAIVNATAIASGGMRIGGPWAMAFPAPDKLKFMAIIEGQANIRFAHQSDPIPLEAGDVLLMNGVPSFVLGSDLSLPPMDALSLYQTHPRVDNTVILGDGADFHMVGGHIDFNSIGRNIVIDALPRWLHIPSSHDEAETISWLLQRLAREMAQEQIGSRMSRAQLAQLVFVQILRAHIARSSTLPTGWLRGLADEKIGPALRLIHENPAHPWQLEELARAVGMSRTSFAQRFRTTVGIAPLGYVRAWRMQLAERALRDGHDPVCEIALSLGYTSESAFSTAFKQVTGQAPRHYRTEHRPPPPSPPVWEEETLPDPADGPF